MIAVAWWTAWPSPWILTVAACLGVGAALCAGTRRSSAGAAGVVVLLLVIPILFTASRRLETVSTRWDAEWAERETEVYEELGAAFDDLVDRGDSAVDRIVQLASRGGAAFDDVEALRSIREASRVTAVALYDGDGTLQLWDGAHRGRVPDGVQFGAAPYLYHALPLFSYLYFTRRLPGGGTAVGVVLLSAELPDGLRARPGDFVSSFEQMSGEELRILPNGEAGGSAFDVTFGDEPEPFLSVQVVRPTEVERRMSLRATWIRFTAVVAGSLWLLFTLVGRGTSGHAWWSLVTFAVIGALLPTRLLFGMGRGAAGEPVFEMALPWGLTLEHLFVLACGGLLVAMLASTRGFRVPARWWTLVLVASTFPLIIGAFESAASVGFLAGEAGGWVFFQLTLTLVLTLICGVVLVLSRPISGETELRGVVAALGGVVLAGIVASWWSARIGVLPVSWAAVWAIPVWGLAVARGGRGPLVGSLSTWLLATAIASTVALPYAWHMRIEARRIVAAEQMRRLEADVDPDLHFLLARVAESLQRRYDRDVNPLEFLYETWIESDLAREGYPVWLDLWTGGPPRQLQFGTEEPRPTIVDSIAEAVRGRREVAVQRFVHPELHYAATAPLGDSAVATVAVPPLTDLAVVSPLGPLFSNLAGGESDPLTLVPLLPDDVSPLTEELRWIRVEEGWRGEQLLVHPGERRFRAQYLVELPGGLVSLARATLLLALSLVVVLGLWSATRLLFAERRPIGLTLRPIVGSFRGRVTAALFGFFVLANAVFGTLAYRTIEGASRRAATVLAATIAQDASAFYYRERREMELLAQQVGADLLEYRDGELREGSAEELIELGLFEAWVPYEVERVLAARESLVESLELRLGRWEYVTAFQRLPDGDVLAVPVPLAAGATAVRGEEIAHLLGFVIIAGGVLSFVLALLVGRTLTRPIRALQVASERVGGGDLDVRLPGQRGDEFGAVFAAFDRMVRRLSRAREELIRTTRRAQAIVDDVATGLIAFDDRARVTLVNPRAVELLGREVAIGARLSSRAGVERELVRWIDLYFRDGLAEGDAEFKLHGRRLRVRARRIFQEGSEGGAVVSLEDVTDELRTERILAWGEMARQVAHEVKNPLTPVKLAIQHVLRAWDDRRPEFGEILTRNADAALREIDRLATIASSFSRFGAPKTAGEEPLGRADLRSVVEEVMTLYGSDEGGVIFRTDLDNELPPVRAREGEIKEVLVNLLENARAAVDADGEVCVEAEVEGDAVVLKVRDNGSGIPEEVQPRIFEPHFSTRSAGAGLGLAIVRQLVESWEGTVWVDSAPGGGTEVSLRLIPWAE